MTEPILAAFSVEWLDGILKPADYHGVYITSLFGEIICL